MANEISRVLETQLSQAATENFVALKKHGVKYPAGFVAENAVKGAMFELSKLKLVEKASTNSLTYNSVINAINDMMIQGLNAVQKQCYFIPYGDEVKLHRSYMGTVTILKRLPQIKDIRAEVIYEGDELETDFVDGETVVTNFKHNWLNQDKPILGAFAKVELTSGKQEFTIMTFEEIKTAWGQGATKGGSPAHKKFAQEMSKKTVINRAAKLHVNTTDMPVAFVDSFNDVTANDYKGEVEQPKDVTPPRDYSSEISELKTLDELGVYWNHTVPDDLKESLIEVYNAKKDELFQEHLAKQQEEQNQEQDTEEEQVDLFENN